MVTSALDGFTVILWLFVVFLIVVQVLCSFSFAECPAVVVKRVRPLSRNPTLRRRVDGRECRPNCKTWCTGFLTLLAEVVLVDRQEIHGCIS